MNVIRSHDCNRYLSRKIVLTEEMHDVINTGAALY